MAGMTSTPTPDDQPDETPGGSTITDPEVFNDPADNDESGNTDNTGDELDAPDLCLTRSAESQSPGRLCRVHEVHRCLDRTAAVNSGRDSWVRAGQAIRHGAGARLVQFVLTGGFVLTDQFSAWLVPTLITTRRGKARTKRRAPAC